MVNIFRNSKKDIEKHPTRYYSKIQEDTVAKEINGKRTPNSGATMWVKSDVMSDKFAIECKTKTSDSESISIKKEWLEKIKQEALFMNKPYEALIFNFGPSSDNFAIINMTLFNELINHLNNIE